MIFFLLSCLGARLVFAWGSWGHKHISRAAVFTLPDPMRTFYYNHIDFITEGAVVPDLRRGLLNDKAESPRHFIDIEDFTNMSIDSFPKTTSDAYKKFDSNTLNKNGSLPWYIQTVTEKLTQAFKKKSKSEIIFLSAELSHYVADAHMPLHTSSNYDGQKTGQRGVHALWESRLPELFGNTYNFKTEAATYIDDIPAETWRMIGQSYSQVIALLTTEKQNRDAFDTSSLYKKDAAGLRILSYNQPVFSDEYASRFHTALEGMVERQLRLSIHDIASYWYTCWVNGGRPDLLSLDDEHLTKQNRKNFKLEYKAWQKGKVLNLDVERE